ncbi:hypothetical protein XENOCAPTIV_013449 [Xenoophorus captivus]|uniref:Secreted protein n=1 Tax=Xenoophorus captivus TaxID=1517983 RepID=A0ABV0QD84_9TELE
MNNNSTLPCKSIYTPFILFTLCFIANTNFHVFCWDFSFKQTQITAAVSHHLAMNLAHSLFALTLTGLPSSAEEKKPHGMTLRLSCFCCCRDGVFRVMCSVGFLPAF